MKHLFHPSLYEFDKPQPSYWESSAGESELHGEALAGTQSCDVAIIGGGYTGLSAALHLARDFNVDVVVLEAGHIGWGASGRNGGFCTTGATKLSLKSQLARFGLEETRRFYQSQDEAVDLVRSLGEDENIDFLAQGDGEFMVAENKAHFAVLGKEAEIERKLLGLDVRIHSRPTPSVALAHAARAASAGTRQRQPERPASDTHRQRFHARTPAPRRRGTAATPAKRHRRLAPDVG
jgi:phytoene dehydrogenase-like protein